MNEGQLLGSVSTVLNGQFGGALPPGCLGPEVVCRLFRRISRKPPSHRRLRWHSHRHFCGTLAAPLFRIRSPTRHSRVARYCFYIVDARLPLCGVRGNQLGIRVAPFHLLIVGLLEHSDDTDDHCSPDDAEVCGRIDAAEVCPEFADWSTRVNMSSSSGHLSSGVLTLSLNVPSTKRRRNLACAALGPFSFRLSTSRRRLVMHRQPKRRPLRNPSQCLPARRASFRVGALRRSVRRRAHRHQSS